MNLPDAADFDRKESLMPRVAIKIMIPFAAVLLVAPAAWAATPLERCLSSQAARQGFSGVLLIQGRTTHAMLVRGVTGDAGSAPITIRTRFDLGSSSKMFIAVAILQLVETGKLGLDDPVGHYVAGLTPAASRVTLRQLLSHSSGLGNFFQPATRGLVQKASMLQELVPLVAREVPAFAPGSRYQYSNTGFLLLGMVIEQVSGRSYADYLRTNIFEPAGMTATSTEPGDVRHRAQGWTTWTDSGPAQPGPDGAPPRLRPSWATADRGNPAGGLFSTAADMNRFFSALMAGRLVSPAMLHAMIAPNVTIVPATADAGGMDMGLGVANGRFEGHRWIGHAGGLPGANAETNMFPDDGITIIVLSNRDPPSATKLYEVARSALFDAPFLTRCNDE